MPAMALKKNNMARTTGRSGFKLRSGNSVPFKELGAKPMAPPKPSKPGSSKEELLEIAEGFVTPVENIDLSGENFDIPTVDSSLVGDSKSDDLPPPPDPPDPPEEDYSGWEDDSQSMVEKGGDNTSETTE